MFNLSGKISDRIRGGKLPRDVNVTKVRDQGAPPPPAKAVRGGSGQGFGEGATRRRSGKGAS